MNGLIDFHTHILPDIDDGAPDLITADQMLDRLAAQGVETVILTPHYYSDTISLNDFLAERNHAYTQLCAYRGNKMPRLILAAEVYYSNVLMNYNDLTPLTIGDSNYILLEMPFHTAFSNHTLERLYQLMMNCNVRFIFAHVDRYPPLVKNNKILDQLLDFECLAQMNLSSLSHSSILVRKKLLRLLDSGHIFALGTDCHNLTSRPPEYTTGIQLIEKKLGSGFITQFTSSINEHIKF